MGAIARIARHSERGYLERLWLEANGDWVPPQEEEIRAFLSVLSRDTEKD